MTICLAGEFLDVRGADRTSSHMQAVAGPIRTEDLHNGLQNRIGPLGVVVGERGGWFDTWCVA
jgi:hypothetical protein